MSPVRIVKFMATIIALHPSPAFHWFVFLSGPNHPTRFGNGFRFMFMTVFHFKGATIVVGGVLESAAAATAVGGEGREGELEVELNTVVHPDLVHELH